MQIDDRLYTSTEVAEILGVSLRSVYRYLEDGKLKAEIKTATGRLRFTKKNIMDFLQPDAAQSSASRPVERVEERPVAKATTSKSAPKTEEDQEDIDWLSRFKASAEKFRQEQEKPAENSAPAKSAPVARETKQEPVENVSGLVDAVEEPEVPSGPQVFYYRSLSGGLKDIAQNVDKVSRRSSVDYAFTLNAGLSLYKPLKDPFSVLHAYIKSQDKDLFEKLLRLVPSDEQNAQLCLIFSEEPSVFETRSELHGLYVVSKDQLKKDIVQFGKDELREEFDSA